MADDRSTLTGPWTAQLPADDNLAILWLVLDVDGFTSGAGPTATDAWASALDAEVLAVLGTSDRPPAGTPAFDAEVVSRASRHRLTRVHIAPADLPALISALDIVEDRVLQLIAAALRTQRES